VRFHNGDAFTARDVIFSLAVLGRDKAFPYDYFRGIEQVEAVDTFSVRITLKAPNNSFINALAYLGYIFPTDYYKSVGEKEFAKAPIGTGPFVFSQWVPGRYVELKANPAYWRGAPAVDILVLRNLPEVASRFALLKTGEVDAAWSLAPFMKADVDATPGLKTVVVNEGRMHRIWIDQKTALKSEDPELTPLRDKRIRQALNYAVDKEAIAKKIWFGFVRPVAATISPAVLPLDHTLQPYPYDPDKARQLLKDAGYPNGFKTTLYTTSGKYLFDKEVSEAVAGYLNEVGVKTSVAVLESGAWNERARSRSVNHMPLVFHGWGATIRHPGGWWDPLSCNAFWGTFCNTELDAMQERAKTIVDKSEMETYYRQIDKRYHEEAPWIFLWDEVSVFGMKSNTQWQIPSASNYRYNLKDVKFSN
jgi:peptide/nickel transport system substrate-binding protein